MPPKPKSGDLFCTVDDNEIHLVLYEETGYYHCYGPLKTIISARSLTSWCLNAQDFEQMFDEGYWRVISVP